MSEQLERTPLYDRHVAADAKIVPFAGFEMPDGDHRGTPCCPRGGGALRRLAHG